MCSSKEIREGKDHVKLPLERELNESIRCTHKIPNSRCRMIRKGTSGPWNLPLSSDWYFTQLRTIESQIERSWPGRARHFS